MDPLIKFSNVFTCRTTNGKTGCWSSFVEWSRTCSSLRFSLRIFQPHVVVEDQEMRRRGVNVASSEILCLWARWSLIHLVGNARFWTGSKEFRHLTKLVCWDRSSFNDSQHFCPTWFDTGNHYIAFLFRVNRFGWKNLMEIKSKMRKKKPPCK